MMPVACKVWHNKYGDQHCRANIVQHDNYFRGVKSKEEKDDDMMQRLAPYKMFLSSYFLTSFIPFFNVYF